jgi:hypothetical protein
LYLNFNLFADKTDTVKKNTETLTHATEMVGLEVNAKKTNYILLSNNQNAGKYPDIKTRNISFENVAH